MLEDLGNLGDFIGGIAVVVTLLYLAVQVRQNTLQLRRAAEIAALEARDITFRSFSQFRSQLIADPGVAEVYLKGIRDAGVLSDVERLRFTLLAQELFYIIETATKRVDAVRPGNVQQTLDELNVGVILKQPGIRNWWTANKGTFQPEFIALIDDQMLRETASA